LVGGDNFAYMVTEEVFGKQAEALLQHIQEA
jgi:hypothetical protein